MDIDEYFCDLQMNRNEPKKKKIQMWTRSTKKIGTGANKKKRSISPQP